MLTTTQKQTAQAIVNLFETGSVRGNYGEVTVIPGDTGHLTFGRSQTTLTSGNLLKLLQAYCDNEGARFGQRLETWLPRVAAQDIGLDTELRLHNLLRATADDPVMRDTQDQFFDTCYWQPALRVGANTGVKSPLGLAVVYDSTVHGSWRLIRDRTDAQIGSLAGVGERAWIAAYVANRRAWLAAHPRSDLRRTIYRMDAFQRLISQGYWGLELPLVVRDAEISSLTLSAMPVGCFDGPQPGSRNISLQTPLCRGLDVRLLQLGLSERGIVIKADGVFGQTSAGLLRQYQESQGMPATGVADALLISQLL